MIKKSLCILQNGLARGGTDTFVVNLCRGIDKNKYDVTVVNPSDKQESLEREPDVLATGARIIHTSPLSGAKSKIRHLRMLYSILKDGKFDVFQTNIDLFNGPNLLVAWLAGIPVRCCHSHNTMQQRSLTEGMTLPICIYQIVMKWMCWRFSNRRTGCSAAAMDFLFTNRSWKKENYPTIINNGIDLDRYKNKINIEAKKKELKLTAKYNIVTVGRIIPQKNPLFIAETFSELCMLRNDCHFVWIGVGDLEEKTKQIFRSNGILDKVHFLGSRTDVNEILQCCDMFYMPSAFEGLGIAIIEAQASGLPCLISDVVPHEANCGACLCLSLKKDKKEWAQSMSDILDGKTVLSVNNYKLQEFSVEHMVEQMQQVFG